MHEDQPYQHGGRRRVSGTKAALAIGAVGALLTPAAATAEVYELRTYTTSEGKLDDLNARFRNHTVELFAKHGMESVGYWVPADPPRSADTLIYVIKHASREAAGESWKAFLADPEWRKVAEESQRDGRILAKPPESVFLELADFSPEEGSADADADGGDGVGGGDGGATVFELRTYHTNEGKLPGLDARFRDHTVGLFARHGMRSVAYWHPADEPASGDTLIYILKHASREAAEESWAAFRSDPEWQRVARESQVDGEFLREAPGSVYLVATDYSPVK